MVAVELQRIVKHNTILERDGENELETEELELVALRSEVPDDVDIEP